LHYQTVAVKVSLPKDFSTWAAGNAVTVDFATTNTSAANNLLDVYIYRDDSYASPVWFSTGNVSGTGDTWTTVNFTGAQLDDGSGVDWDTADQTAILFLRMGSQSNNNVKVGAIKINYLSKF
jgi:hypothetical protein